MESELLKLTVKVSDQDLKPGEIPATNMKGLTIQPKTVIEINNEFERGESIDGDYGDSNSDFESPLNMTPESDRTGESRGLFGR